MVYFLYRLIYLIIPGFDGSGLVCYNNLNMITKSQKLLYSLIKKGEVIEDKTKLAKLQYFADFIHYAFYNHPISDEGMIYTKQKQGPLSRTLTDDIETLKKEGLIVEQPNYHYKIKENLKVNLSKEEEKTLDFVIDKYGKASYKELVDICHAQTPYLSTGEGQIVEFFTAYNLVDDYPDYATSIKHNS
ncbi:MAG: hypothetical protein UR42_C0008G0004 [Candidatus Roizmanbacteria bacterium GW2011_GWA2_33_33]|uniref:Antitoxin SocA-like Panacea domain-containing protein n=1 Tax=Candidatus Roizmanbacteria bacterium GW2011_GWA2_33_33 TaxID=1618476 RepID=A0A0G0A5W5_9BACT|nr:MAG: hypothetical protein UR42_C0008G0004 [Candidatus Roizmanbacteria bacterium GW2011_GWA2_33_33]